MFCETIGHRLHPLGLVSRRAICALPLLGLTLSAAGAQAPTTGALQYPLRPVRVIVGLAAGSSTDVTARIIAQRLGESLGQQFVIENRPGAGGNIATEFVAHAPKDGYTLLLGSVATTVNVTLSPNKSFDFVRDLVPVVLLATVPNLLVVHPSLGVHSLEELIRLAKAKPGEIFYASSGVGTSPHLSAELFNREAGLKLMHVPYQGSGQAMNDLVAGRVSLMFAPASTALPHVKSGSLVAIASTQRKRAAAAPDLPTMDELGMRGFDTGVWFGLFAPSGTSPEIVNALADAANQALSAPAVIASLRAQGIDPVGGTPAAFRTFVTAEIEKWRAVIDTAGLKKSGEQQPSVPVGAEGANAAGHP